MVGFLFAVLNPMQSGSAYVEGEYMRQWIADLNQRHAPSRKLITIGIYILSEGKVHK